MTFKLAINGFGRIGRLVFRTALQRKDIEIVAVNDLTDAKMLAHLLKYDSVHGKLDAEVTADGDNLIVDGKTVRVYAEKDPANLPWGELNVDIVVESTGFFTNYDDAKKHVDAGAKKVIVSAPGKNMPTFVMGVNHEKYDAQNDVVFSNASCTTNCLAPVAKVLNDTFGIDNGLMTTVHSYTNDQKNIDNPHKDLRRARSCAESIIPTSTGAAKALTLVLPELKGKLHGMALRVPTPNVSLVDLVVDLNESVTVEQVNAAFIEASKGSLKGILDFTMEPLVSSDFNTNPASATIDGLTTMVMGDKKVKVLAWYDNEWGYSSRVVDLTKKVIANLTAVNA